MKQSLSCLLLLSAVGVSVLIVLAPKSIASAVDMEFLDPEALAALQAEEGSAKREQVLEKLVSVLRSLSRNGNEYDYSSNPGLSKRQIRYHQCYFNPISCFRRRK